MKPSANYFTQILFFIKGFEIPACLIITLSILIGLIDALSIALLYPMISAGFQINFDSVPFYETFQKIGSFLPMGSPFVNIGIFFICLTIFSFFLQLLYWRLAFIFQTKIVINAKQKLFEKTKANDFKFFVDTRQGDLINVFNMCPMQINGTFDRLFNLCADLFTSIMIIIMLFLISPGGLVIVLLGGSFFYIILSIIGKNISTELGRLQIESGESENKAINEYITGIKAIVSYNRISFWEKIYERGIQIYWSRYALYMFIQRIPVIAINSMFYIAIGLIVVGMYIFYSHDFISLIPVIGTFAAGTLKILPKFTNMGDYKLQLKNGAPHVEKVYNVLHDDRYQKIINGDIRYTSLNSDIQIKNISFSYSQRTILNNISLAIKKGRVTALVGYSGSGKSTITSLLLRLYDPDSGQILINERDLKSYDINTIREKIGYVSQEPFIFNGTLRENVAFGGEYSDEEVIWALKSAHASDFISLMEDGLDTMVGDQGVKLSGGEKQRIVIARAVIRKPDIMILDEATSSLDNISEAIVQQAIDDIAKECTTLIIAHRLSTIQNADWIYVLNQGRVVEEGNHKTLIEKRGYYEEMYKTGNHAE
jgi:ABC-type multidrug transport system fused ATPase/permease subunit